MSFNPNLNFFDRSQMMRVAPFSHKYRPDIDALRGVSIISVIFFHYGLLGFKGGFCGVDVFFVISGFLITGIISSDISNGRFTFSGFYLRRARRLLPSLLTVLTASFVIAFFVLSPPHFERFSKALLYSLGSASNFFYINEVGYFDVAAALKPLLHTWSLGVEGQFYAVWPLMLYLSLRRRWILVASLAAAFSISLFTAVIFRESASAYYFPLFRFYGFVLGTVAFFFARWNRFGVLINSLIYGAGFVAILLSFFFFDKEMPYPSYAALLPCLGASLMIYSGQSAHHVIIKLVANKGFEKIGIISYPLYLIHWPALVFYRYNKMGGLDLSEKVFLISASVLLAYILYRFVEKPIRKHLIITSRQVKFSGALPKAIVTTFAFVTIIGIPAISLAAADGSGWPWRFSNINATHITAQLSDNLERRAAYHEKHNVLPLESDSQKPLVLIIGDSHSVDLFNALSMNRKLAEKFSLYQYYLDEKCFSPRPVTRSLARRIFYKRNRYEVSRKCLDKRRQLISSKQLRRADTVIIASDWPMDNLPFLEPTVSFYKKHFSNSKILLWGTNDLPIDPATFIFARGGLNDISKMIYRLDSRREYNVDEMVKRVALELGVKYYDFHEKLCNEDTKECSVVDSGNILFLDNNHWTFEGERYFGQVIGDILLDARD